MIAANTKPPNCQPEKTTSRTFIRVLVLVALSALTSAAVAQTQPDGPYITTPIPATHIVGFEGVRRNVKGAISIQAGDLRFRSEGSTPVQISATSIQSISIGEQDKQVGGVPMMLGKAVIPFSGGRVVSLFSHKKYDSIAIDYVDAAGGFHGAVFRLPKGQGELVKSVLLAGGACKLRQASLEPTPTQIERSTDVGKWSVLVELVNPGDTAIDPSFTNAIYENVVRELSNSKQFARVIRSCDRSAGNLSALLILKTTVEKYFPGSETRRAVTTVGGATKLKVRIQLVTRDGRVVVENSIQGNVRFIGDNFGATVKVARTTASTLKQASLPPPTSMEQTIAKGTTGI